MDGAIIEEEIASTGMSAVKHPCVGLPISSSTPRAVETPVARMVGMVGDGSCLHRSAVGIAVADDTTVNTGVGSGEDAPDAYQRLMQKLKSDGEGESGAKEAD